MSRPFERITRDNARAMALLHKMEFKAPWPESAFLELLQSPGAFGFCKLASDKPSHIDGFVLCRGVAAEVEILTLVVDHNLRRQGIARRLLDHLIASALARQHREIFLEVAEDNSAALALYEQAGFTAVGRRADYYKNGGADAQKDALLMKLDLSVVAP